MDWSEVRIPQEDPPRHKRRKNIRVEGRHDPFGLQELINHTQSERPILNS